MTLSTPALEISITSSIPISLMSGIDTASTSSSVSKIDVTFTSSAIVSVTSMIKRINSKC